jgi:NAD(P)-dependent dehydrogenase (short-subunit alcohol dehydrogenase family)
MAGPLARTVAVVPVGAAAADAVAVARRLAAGGAAVVVVAEEGDAAAAGRLTAEVEASGSARAAVFTLSGEATPAELDALAELVAELFR